MDRLRRDMLKEQGRNVMAEQLDWTVGEGLTNNSAEFKRLVSKVASIIRDSGATLLQSGGVESVSRAILADLAHKEGFSPAFPKVAELEKAAWAVRVLDRWAARVAFRKYVMEWDGETWECVCVEANCSRRLMRMSSHLLRPTPDAARIAAAEALVAEDPTLDHEKDGFEK